MTPKTMSDWQLYIQNLSDDRLMTEARSANTVTFSGYLSKEGYTADEIGEILMAFALELHARDLPLSDRGPGQMASYFRMVQGYPEG